LGKPMPKTFGSSRYAGAGQSHAARHFWVRKISGKRQVPVAVNRAEWHSPSATKNVGLPDTLVYA